MWARFFNRNGIPYLCFVLFVMGVELSRYVVVLVVQRVLLFASHRNDTRLIHLVGCDDASKGAGVCC